MRSRPTPDPSLAEVTRRRLQLLSAEIAAARSDLPHPRPEGHSDEPVDLRPRAAAPGPAGRHARRSVGWRGLATGWLEDRLPPTLQGRVRLGAAHLVVLAVAVAVGLVVTAWWVLRTDDAGELVPASAPVGAASAGAEAEPLATPAAPPGEPAVVVVDVAGKVRRPGIATLPVGSRVVDALRAAGGVRPGVDRASINLARPLVDGEQIVVGEPTPTGVAAPEAGSAPTGPTLVNLNTADQAILESLPGVGPVTAQAILAWREENGGFQAVDDLLDVSGIGQATLAKLVPFVTL